MKKIQFMILILVAVFFTACNEQVPAGHVGKILGVKGFQPEIFPPSKVWLANNFWNLNPEHLYTIQTTTSKYKETVDVLLKDKLGITADVYFRGRIVKDTKRLNALFNDMPLKNTREITTNMVYKTYAQMVVRNTAREVLSQYNVDEINKNYSRLSGELYNALKPKLKFLPIEISDITISSIKYPKMVTEAIESAKKRRMDIEKEQANVQIALTKAKGQEEVGKATYRIKMMEAKRIRDYNKMISEGVSPELLELRKLENQEKLIDAIQNNKNVIYMPMDMMSASQNMRIIK